MNTSRRNDPDTAREDRVVVVKPKGKDPRSKRNFSHIIFGPNGISKLHAMVERSPLLMYPPKGVPAARKEALSEQMDVDTALEAALQDEDDVAEVEIASKRQRLEADLTAPMDQSRREVAQYHHKQLDCYLKLVYEFNHATMLKVPMSDTIHSLTRLGPEVLAHIEDFERPLRAAQARRLSAVPSLKAAPPAESEHVFDDTALLEELEELGRADAQARDTLESLLLDDGGQTEAKGEAYTSGVVLAQAPDEGEEEVDAEAMNHETVSPTSSPSQ